MTHPSTSTILSELRSASSPACQIKALRDVKNEIVGHVQKKQIWIGLGVLTPLTRILNSYKGNGKRRHRDTNGHTNNPKPNGSKNDEEEACSQAIVIVGSLAHGGPPFLPPIYASSTISPLLALLSPFESHPQVILQSLKTLNTIADSIFLSDPNQEYCDSGLPSLLYTEKSLLHVNKILLQRSDVPIVQQQIALTATLISKTCRDETYRVLLAQAGILEALAINLAPWVVASPSSHSPDHRKRSNDRYRTSSTAAPPLTPILQAIGAIVQHSRSRSIQLLHAPALNSSLQKLAANSCSSHEKKLLWEPNPTANQITQAMLNSVPSRLPKQQSCRPLASSAGFPPVGTIGTSTRHMQSCQSFSSAVEVLQTQGLEYVGEEESPLISWLLQAFGGSDELTNLMAAWVIAIFYRQGLIKSSKEPVIALLLIPSLVRMLNKDVRLSVDHVNLCWGSDLRETQILIREQAPAVLAMLTADSSITQKAATDANAIKRLSQLLKESYDTLPANSSNALWTADVVPLERVENGDGSLRLGSPGLPLELQHTMKIRETVLVALASLASEKDEYRKAIIDNGVVPFVIRTLKIEDSVLSSPDRSRFDSLQSNTNSRDAVMAACGAARALSRSVSTLRTSLMDAGLAAPLFSLLRCRDLDIQVAATAVVCNLVLEFSPMREAILEAGILKILCDHAHSVNASLRLNSMWALKHLVVGASNEVKIDCLEELGPSWLKQIISNDIDTTKVVSVATKNVTDRDDDSTTPMRMSTPNAAGEQVDLLNAVEVGSRGSSQDLDVDGDEDSRMSDSIGALRRADVEHKDSASGHRPHHDPLEAIGSVSTQMHSLHQGLSDELAVQKEGFEFIRNLVCGPHASDMIDHVFRELGQEEVFDVLAIKLRPRVLNAFDRERRSSENGVRTIQPQTDILKSVCYTLVHIAAGHPRHRQLLVSQTALLEALTPLFNHSNEEVRACCAWIVINLTWEDDQNDRAACKARARTLAEMGMMQKVQLMERDPSLNCRERGKNAFNSMVQLSRS